MALTTRTANKLRSLGLSEACSAINDVADNSFDTAVVTTLTLNVAAFNGATGVNELQVPTNLADALSIEDSAGDLIKFDTTTGTQVITVTPAMVITGAITSNGGITMGDAKNIAINTGTGTKIGTAVGQKIGFWNATPVVQQGAFTQTYATADKTHANRRPGNCGRDQ
jgi:hypothetical protein